MDGDLTMRIIDVTQTVDVTGINELLVCNSANPIAVNLLRSATGTHGGYYIKNIGVGDVTVTPQQNDTIDGAGTIVVSQYSSINIIDYKETIWLIISHSHV